MESLRKEQFRTAVECIVELEERLHVDRLCLSRECQYRRQLAVLYGILEELWPIVPGRGTRSEP
jgi:hypothetical protein